MTDGFLGVWDENLDGKVDIEDAILIDEEGEGLSHVDDFGIDDFDGGDDF